MIRMIKAKDVKFELRKALKDYEKAKDINEKIDIIFKLITVLLKLTLSVRTNSVIMMKHQGIDLKATVEEKSEKKEEK